jgi:hypothetical protein
VKLKLTAILIATILLAGCGQNVWLKPGATAQDFNVDSYGCEKDARQSGYFGGGIVGQINFDEFEGRCTRAHGWTLTHLEHPNSAIPPGNDPADPNVMCKISDNVNKQMPRSSCTGRGGTEIPW